MAKQVRRVLPRDLAHLVVVQSAQATARVVLRVGPRRVRVGIVALQHDVVGTQPVAHRERRRQIDGAEPEVPSHGVDRGEVRISPRAVARGGVGHHPLEPVHQHRRPPEATFGERNVELREPQRNLRPQPVCRGRQRIRREQRAVQLERRTGRARGRPARGTTVEAHDRVRLLTRSQQRIPVVGVHRRQPEVDRILEKAHRLEAALGVAPNLVGGDVRVGQPRDLERDYAIRVLARPFVEVPVVPRPRAREPELLVLALRKHHSRETREQGREAQRRVDPVEIHVGNARVAVPATGAHLVETARLGVPLVLRPARDRVQTDLRVQNLLVEPHLLALVVLDDAWRRRDEVRRHPPLEEVAGLDHVVINGDDRVLALPRLRVG